MATAIDRDCSRLRLCPVCGDRISSYGRTNDGRAVGSCGDAFWPRSRKEREDAGITAVDVSPVVRDAATAGLARCRLCDAGFRRIDGVHIGSQSLGMIPDTACERVFATCGDDPDAARPWLAHVDGEPLRKRSGEARRFASLVTAYVAARAAAPRRWHS